jgi:hypothetical protein
MSPSTTAPTLRNAGAAQPASFMQVNLFWPKKIVGRTGLNMSAQVELRLSKRLKRGCNEHFD